MKLFYFILVAIVVSSCQNEHDSHHGKFNQDHYIEVSNYTGNALVFYSIKTMGYKVFIIPVAEKDSNVFVKRDIDSLSKGRPSLQISFGDDYLNCLKADTNREILMNSICNIPRYDTLFYSRVYISYKNLAEIPILQTNKKGIETYERQPDSCGTILLTGTDSSSFSIFHIYGS